MPHIHVVQAQTVLANPANYPEIIVANAQRIVQWSDAKRVAIQWLWNHRDVLHAWRRARVGQSHMEKSRNATRAVMLSGALSSDKMNDFHKNMIHRFERYCNRGNISAESVFLPMSSMKL